MEQIFQLLFKETKSLSSEEFDDMKLSSNFSYDDAALVNNAQTSMVSAVSLLIKFAPAHWHFSPHHRMLLQGK